MKKILLFMLFVIPFVIIGANAQTYDALDIYMQPRVMEEDGSIEIAVRIRNVETAVIAESGGISAIRINVSADTEAFAVADEPISLVEGGLITHNGDISASVFGGIVNITFNDTSIGERFITSDGYLFNLNIRAVNPRGFFHSPYTYPVAIDKDSALVMVYNEYGESELYNVNVWGVEVGGQVFPTLLPPLGAEIADEIAFADDMIPLRSIADAAGAGIAWRAADRTAVIATVENLKVFIIQNSDVMTVVGVEVNMPSAAVIRDNRIFIPHESAVKIFPTLQK